MRTCSFYSRGSFIKEGSGRELRQLHDVLSRHLRALNAKDPYGPFVTALVELKLDQLIMFEWQRQSQDATDTPHFERLLKFLHLKAQASESFVQGTQKRQAQIKPSVQLRSAYTTNVSPACNVCRAPKHPLFMCKKFKSLPCEKLRHCEPK